jgi:hypothetical protein
MGFTRAASASVSRFDRPNAIKTILFFDHQIAPQAVAQTLLRLQQPVE